MTKRAKYEMLVERRAKLLGDMLEAVKNKDMDKYKILLVDFCLVAGELERLLEECW